MTDLQAVEAELCRLPGVVVARVLEHGDNRPVTATLFVSGGIPIDRLAGYAKSVAAVHFDLNLDANKVVIIDISDLARSSGPVVGVPANANPGDAAGQQDSLQALQAAQRSAETLLERLTSRTDTPAGNAPAAEAARTQK